MRPARRAKKNIYNNAAWAAALSGAPVSVRHVALLSETDVLSCIALSVLEERRVNADALGWMQNCLATPTAHNHLEGRGSFQLYTQTLSELFVSVFTGKSGTVITLYDTTQLLHCTANTMETWTCSVYYSSTESPLFAQNVNTREFFLFILFFFFTRL